MRRSLAILLLFLMVSQGACLNEIVLPSVKTFKDRNFDIYEAWRICIENYSGKMHSQGYDYNSSYSMADDACKFSRVEFLNRLTFESRSTPLDIRGERELMRETVLRKMMDSDAASGKSELSTQKLYEEWQSCLEEYIVKLRAHGYSYDSSYNTADNACRTPRVQYLNRVGSETGSTHWDIRQEMNIMREKMLRKMIDSDATGRKSKSSNPASVP